ncbi:MAG: hypothetical protein DRQ47_05620 [Gammaproteobacteria bacterium]|nr:MAG: hypothetical protein DRQ47_05620 [Gammaproteobacteria bacterium]
MDLPDLNFELNTQHKELIKISQTLTSLLEAEAESNHDEFIDALEQLLDFSTSHFVAEERLMYIRGYPQIEEHKIAHNDFLTKIVPLISRVTHHVSGSHEEVAQFLADWLENHVFTEDKKLEQFLKG